MFISARRILCNMAARFNLVNFHQGDRVYANQTKKVYIDKYKLTAERGF